MRQRRRTSPDTDGNGNYSLPGIGTGSVTFTYDSPVHSVRTDTAQVAGDMRRDVTLNALFSRTGVGDNVFDMPSSVSRVRIIGTYTGFCENFIVRIAGRLIVNVILGSRSCSWASTGQRHEGTYVTSGGVVEITSSSGVVWEFSQVR